MANILLYETLDDTDYAIMVDRILRILKSEPVLKKVLTNLFHQSMREKKLYRFRKEGLTVRIEISTFLGRVRNVFMVVDSENGRDHIQITGSRYFPSSENARIFDKRLQNINNLVYFTDPEHLKQELREFIDDYIE